jgi:hypothetical protein
VGRLRPGVTWSRRGRIFRACRLGSRSLSRPRPEDRRRLRPLKQDLVAASAARCGCSSARCRCCC